MERSVLYENELNFRATELRLGLPGRDGIENDSVSSPKRNKRPLFDADNAFKSDDEQETSPPAKAQIVGWPPVRSNRRKNISESVGVYVKVSMDGAAYLRKIDLKVYEGYPQLLKALQNMFKCTVGEHSDLVPTYEDKDNDWMLVGDVPWEMFVSSCKRLRIMKGSEAKGLGCPV